MVSFLKDIKMNNTSSGKNAANLNGHHAKKGRKATPDSPEKNESHDTDGAEFPIHVLPTRLAEMATAIADSRQMPLAWPAGALLATVAASIGRGLCVVSGPGRETSPNLFLLASAGSGVGKSTIMKDVTGQIRRLQESLRLGEIEPQFPVPETHIPTLTVDDITGAGSAPLKSSLSEQCSRRIRSPTAPPSAPTTSTRPSNKASSNAPSPTNPIPASRNTDSPPRDA